MLIKDEQTELMTTDDMVAIVKDWTGGCPSRPGNTDVLEVIMGLGIPPNQLAAMAQLLADGTWSRYAIGKLILEVTSSSRVMAALARHGKVYHGLRMDEARKDLRELRAEAREVVQREVLRRMGDARQMPRL